MSESSRSMIDRIEAAVRDVPGWSPIDQLFALFNLTYASAHLGGDVLELGSWCGRSAAALGLAVRASGIGHVHCVDLFPEKDDWYRNADGSYSFRVNIEGQVIESYHQQTVWQAPFERDIAPLYERHGGLFARFNATVKDNHLESIVLPFRGELSHFFSTPRVPLRLAFLDGHHSFEALCHDIECVTPHLLPGGWLCFDDAFTSYEGVDHAIQEKVIGSPNFRDGQQLTRKLFVARKAT